MKILGLSMFYHESAACILIDGKVVAACAQERFSRVKHDFSFPLDAIESCLKEANLKVAELDYVVLYEKPFQKFERNLTISLRYFPKSYWFFIESTKNFLTEKLWVKSIIQSKLKISAEKILFVPHHLSHASAAFYSSPFKSAAFLTLDGVGEWSTGSWGICVDNKIYPQFELKFPNSVGLLYSTFTAFLGFEVNDGEYKLMGMAGFGQPKYVSKIKKLVKIGKDGSILLNLDYFSFYLSSKRMFSNKFLKEFGHLLENEQDRYDLASSIQVVTEEIVFNMLNHIQKVTGQENLVFGGGVALNSVLNSKIIKKTNFKNLFIFPAAGDDGGALGCALYAYHHVLGFKKHYQIEDVFLGSEYKNFKFPISNFKYKIKKLDINRLTYYIAEKLSEGKVVGWFEGRAEFGPRALGHRSILADPRRAEMKDIVNLKIKFREPFRPFAPVILREYANQYFMDIQENLAKYMLGTFKAKTITKKVAPAIVHIDNTSRIQTVSKNYPGKLRQLLIEFNRITKLPMLLNTSFNIKGQPIVNSPEDALWTFKKTDIDLLVIENFVIEKK